MRLASHIDLIIESLMTAFIYYEKYIYGLWAHGQVSLSHAFEQIQRVSIGKHLFKQGSRILFLIVLDFCLYILYRLVFKVSVHQRLQPATRSFGGSTPKLFRSAAWSIDIGCVSDYVTLSTHFIGTYRTLGRNSFVSHSKQCLWILCWYSSSKRFIGCTKKVSWKLIWISIFLSFTIVQDPGIQSRSWKKCTQNPKFRSSSWITYDQPGSLWSNSLINPHSWRYLLVRYGKKPY
jgi:hypothetical protein